MTTPADEDEFTALVDPDISRMDQVDKAANGTPWLIAKSAAPEEGPALFDASFVRDLVAKADAEQQPAPESVTVTGSPGAIARMLKQAADRAAGRKAERSEYVEFVKAKYSAADKRKLAAQGHAMHNAGGEPDYPIDDAEDLGRAIHAVGRGGANHDKIRAYVIRRAREMGKSDQIPDNWASDGSLKQTVSKADGFGDPGSPAWEGQDADTADGIVQAILALRPRLQAFAAREGAEAAAGDMGDLCDVFDLQAARDCLMQAAKLVGGVAVAERAEAGPLAKATTTPAASAAPSPQESTVTETPAVEATAAAPAAVAKGDGVTSPFSPDKAARIYKEAAEKAARKAIKKAAKAAVKTSGAAAAPQDARTIPGTDTVQAPAQAPDEVTKAAAAQLSPFAEVMASVAKQVENLATLVGNQSERVEKALAKPDDRRSPLLNGATGEPMLAERGNSKNPTGDPRFQAVIKAVAEMADGPDKAQLQRTIALGAIAGTMGHSAEVMARFRQ